MNFNRLEAVMHGLDLNEPVLTKEERVSPARFKQRHTTEALYLAVVEQTFLDFGILVRAGHIRVIISMNAAYAINSIVSNRPRINSGVYIAKFNFHECLFVTGAYWKRACAQDLCEWDRIVLDFAYDVLSKCSTLDDPYMTTRCHPVDDLPGIQLNNGLWMDLHGRFFARGDLVHQGDSRVIVIRGVDPRPEIVNVPVVDRLQRMQIEASDSTSVDNDTTDNTTPSGSFEPPRLGIYPFSPSLDDDEEESKLPSGEDHEMNEDGVDLTATE